MSVATAPDRHGLSIRRTPHGWALFRGSEHLYETNNRERVEWALQEELDRLKLGEVLRQVLASRECPTATLPAPAARAARIGQATIGRPQTRCSIFGSEERIRVPSPAARTRTRGELTARS